MVHQREMEYGAVLGQPVEGDGWGQEEANIVCRERGYLNNDAIGSNSKLI